MSDRILLRQSRIIFIFIISLLVFLSFIGCTEDKTIETSAKIEATEAKTQPPLQTPEETEQAEPQIQTEEATTSTETEQETETSEPPKPFFDPLENPDAIYLDVKKHNANAAFAKRVRGNVTCNSFELSRL